MVKHKIARTFLALLLAGGLMPVMAFAAEDGASVTDLSVENAGAAAKDEGASGAEAGSQQPAVQPQEPIAQPEVTVQPEQAPAVTEIAPVVEPVVEPMVDPGENSWRFDNGASTTDGLIEGPISLDERLTAATGPNGWHDYQQGYFTGIGNFKGIDVSYHQGIIDWSAVRNAGVDFAIIRCGYGDDIRSQDDAQWLRNVRGAQQAGIPFGVYLYSYAKRANTVNAADPQSAQSEGEHALRCLREAGLGPADVALPVYYDMEDRSMGSDYAGMAQRFCDIVGGAGYATGIYACKDWWESKLTHGWFSGVEKWVAQYNSHAGLQYGGFNKDRDIWQFSSSGRIAGIPGNVDLNYTNRIGNMVQPGEQVVPDGTYSIMSVLAPNRAVDVVNCSPISGTNIWIYEENNSEAQRFKLEFHDGFYTMSNVKTGGRIDVSNGSRISGANIWSCTPNSSDAQKWRIDRNDDGTYTFIAKCSGMALDVTDAKTDFRTNIQQCTVNGSNAQRFTLVDKEVKPGEQAIESGLYTIASAIDQNMVIDVENGSTMSTANIQLFRNNGTMAQQFSLTYRDGFYTIINLASGKAIDLANGLYEPRSNIWQCSPNGTDAQKWRIDRNSDGTYTLVSKRSGYVMDVRDGLMENGTNIWQLAPNGGDAQKFRFQRLSDNIGIDQEENEATKNIVADVSTRLFF